MAISPVNMDNSNRVDLDNASGSDQDSQLMHAVAMH